MSHKGYKYEDITRRVANDNNMAISAVKTIFDAYINEFINALQTDNSVRIPRLGTLLKDKYGYHYHPANYLIKERTEKY